MVNRLHDMNILLLEDSKEAARMTIMILEREGAIVHWESDPLTALKNLDMLYSKKYDVILSDIGLPSISGFEFCERAKRNPILYDTPIIALSGFEKDNERSKKSGFSDHYVKPMKPSKLITNLEHARYLH